VGIFEEPHFATFGAAYEKRPRYSAGAYSPVVRRLESFLEVSLEKGLKVREARADRLLAFGRVLWGEANEYPQEILLHDGGKPAGLFHLRIT